MVTNVWRREHHGMFPSRGLKWYWGKIISPETKSRDLYSSFEISFQYPKILGTFRDVPDNKVAIKLLYCMATHCLTRLRSIARRNLQNSVFFSCGEFPLTSCASVQCTVPPPNLFFLTAHRDMPCKVWYARYLKIVNYYYYYYYCNVNAV